MLGYSVFKDMGAQLYYGSYSLTKYVTYWNADAFVLTTVIPLIIMIVVNLLVVNSKLKLSPLRFLRHDLSRSKRKKAVKLASLEVHDKVQDPCHTSEHSRICGHASWNLLRTGSADVRTYVESYAEALSE